MDWNSLNERQRQERMEQIRREKESVLRKGHRLVGNSAEREAEKHFRKREQVLQKSFLDVIKADRHNAEALYRYGFYLMERHELTRAIQRFEQALEVHESARCSFPLSEAQVLKAHMYKGLCAGEILKISLQKVDELNIAQKAPRLDTEGRSLDTVLIRLQNESEHYVAFENGQKRMISVEDYLLAKDTLEDEKVLISFVEQETLMQLGANDPVRVPTAKAMFLRFMLEQIMEKGYVSQRDFEDVYESQSSWRLHNTTMTRLNSLIDYPVFAVAAGTFAERYPQSIVLNAPHHMIVMRRSDFINYTEGEY